jgi:hypothetical protein
MRALLDGQILNQGAKPFHLRQDGKFYFLSESEPLTVYLSSKYLDETYISTPPKRKIKTTRWFAIIEPDRWSRMFMSETEARHYWPGALTYHCATAEIEVDGSWSDCQLTAPTKEVK